MKKSVVRIGLVALAAMVMSQVSVNAQKASNFIYDTKTVNDKVVSQTVFTHEDGNYLLTRSLKYEFTYTEEGKLQEKTAYLWDKDTEQWNKYYRLYYNYNLLDGDIEMQYAQWDASTSTFSKNPERMVYQTNAFNELVSCTYYHWDELHNAWEIKNNLSKEENYALLADK